MSTCGPCFAHKGQSDGWRVAGTECRKRFRLISQWHKAMASRATTARSAEAEDVQRGGNPVIARSRHLGDQLAPPGVSDPPIAARDDFLSAPGPSHNGHSCAAPAGAFQGPPPTCDTTKGRCDRPRWRDRAVRSPSGAAAAANWLDPAKCPRSRLALIRVDPSDFRLTSAGRHSMDGLPPGEPCRRRRLLSARRAA